MENDKPVEPESVATENHLSVERFPTEPFPCPSCGQLLAPSCRVCVACKEPEQIPQQALTDAGYTPEEAKTTQVFHGRGCTTCNNTGYKGRVGLYEVMEINDDVRELVLVGASALELKKKALETGMITLRRSGLIKMAAGLTTMEEVLRETVV